MKIFTVVISTDLIYLYFVISKLDLIQVYIFLTIVKKILVITLDADTAIILILCVIFQIITTV